MSVPAMEIKQGIHWVGAKDWDRRLFDELIPLPDGTTYNSYVVKGNNKVALMDTGSVLEWQDLEPDVGRS